MKNPVEKAIAKLREAIARVEMIDARLVENEKLAAQSLAYVDKHLSGVNLGAATLDDSAQMVLTERAKVDVLTSQRPRIEKEREAALAAATVVFKEERQVVAKVAWDRQRAEVERMTALLKPLFPDDPETRTAIGSHAARLARYTVESRAAARLPWALDMATMAGIGVSLETLKGALAALEKEITK